MPKSIYHIPRMHGPHGVFASPFGSSSEPTVHYHHGVVCQERNKNGECVHYYAPGLHYRGGEVIKEPKLYLIFYGSNWNTLEEDKKWKGALLNTLRGMTTEYAFDETYQRILHQYYDDQTEPKQISNTMTVAGEWTYESIPAPQNLTEENVELAVNQSIETNHWTREKNAIFMLMEPKGSAWTEAFAKKTECGYHFVDRWSDVYALIPNDNDYHFNSGCVVGTTNQRAETETATHEYMEAVTDPHPQEGSTPGWNNSEGYEIADLCDEEPELLNETLSIWVSAVWGNAEKTCVIHDPPELGPLAPTAATEAATNVQYSQAAVTGSVNPNGPDTHYYVEYGMTKSYGLVTPNLPGNDAGYGESAIPVTIHLELLEQGDQEYHYRVVASSWAGTTYGADQRFVTLYPPPEVKTISATEVGPTISTLRGEFKTFASEHLQEDGERPPHPKVTTYFEYGTTTSYGSRTAELEESGGGNGWNQASRNISGLTPNTSYHYRMVSSTNGGASYGNDVTFTTTPSPYALTEAPTNVTLTEATLRGKLNPGGYSGTYQFEYWPAGKSSEVKYVPAAAELTGSGTSNIPVSQKVSGLTGLASYQYRLRVTTSQGTAYGDVQSLTSWAAFLQKATTNPNGALESRLEGVSCAAVNMCVAAGWAGEPGKTESIIERWNGNEWILQSVSAPPEATTDVFEAVSCASTTMCVAIGSYDKPGGWRPYTVWWNGQNWSSPETIPALVNGFYIGPRGVTCISSEECIAVGIYTNSNDVSQTAAMRWTSSTHWSTLSTPNENSYANDLQSVSCASATACVAVGAYNPTEPGTSLPLAEWWNGKEWSLLSVPNPSGAEGSQLAGVSCVSSMSCLAVGDSWPKEGAWTPMADRWNGTSWSQVPVPSPTGTEERGSLERVSCVSTTACVAVGQYYIEKNLSPLPLIEHWNGSEWTTASTEGESTIYSGELWGISCLAPLTCVTAGGYSKTHLVTYAAMVLPPYATSELASNVSETGATLNSTVNPEGWETTYHYEYGPTTSYGNSVPLPEASAGSGSSVHAVQALSGLQGGTVYHYRLVATNANGTTNGPDGTFTTPGKPMAETKPATSVGETTSKLNGSVNPRGSVTKYYFEYGTTTSYGAMTTEGSAGSGSTTVEESQSISGLSLGTLYHFRVVATNANGTTAGFDRTFTPTGKPVAETKAATSMAEHAAVLNGNVNPKGSETKYYFEYGPTSSYGSKTAETNSGSGIVSTEQAQAITALTASTTYHFRMVAVNADGYTYGTDQSFSTTGKPSIKTQAATNVGETEATLNGNVNPRDAETMYYFEYGPTETYGSRTPEASAGAGSSSVSEKATITGLVPGARYHFRLVATNRVGTTDGGDLTVTTVSTATDLGAMATTEPFNGTSSAISNFAINWSTLGWATGSPAKGENITSGWGPVSAYPEAAGSYYMPTVADAGRGIADIATMAENPSLEKRYFSLWLDMTSAGSTRSGYELTFSDISTGIYEVKLSKWSNGTQTILASTTSYAFANGDNFALADRGSTVSAWTNTGSGFKQLLTASDSTFDSGNAGVEAAGNITRLTNFKVGELLSPESNAGATLETLNLIDPFSTSESPLSAGGAFAALSWDNGTPGYDTGHVESGWGPYDAYPTINGAYWQKATFADTGAGDAVAAKLSTNPQIENRHFALWLNMPNPATAQSGYELRFRETSASTYEVVLAKWVSGTEMALASKNGYSLAVGSLFAIEENGGKVSAWTKAGTEYTQLFTASDATYTSGYSGIEGSGNNSRLKEFRSGPLPPP